MSQFFLGTSDSNLPPDVPTSFVTDNGTVIPANHVVNINGGSTSSNNANGIQVIANPDGSNNEVVQLTNRLFATLTTTNATPQTLLNFPLGSTPGAYNIFLQLSTYDSTNNEGGGLTLHYSVRTDGATATKIGVANPLDVEDSIVLNETLTNITLGGNTLTIQVTGGAATIVNWTVLITYVFAHV